MPYINVTPDELDRLGVKGPVTRALRLLEALDDIYEQLGDMDFTRCMADIIDAIEADHDAAIAVIRARIKDPLNPSAATKAEE